MKAKGLVGLKMTRNHDIFIVSYDMNEKKIDVKLIPSNLVLIFLGVLFLKYNPVLSILEQ